MSHKPTHARVAEKAVRATKSLSPHGWIISAATAAAAVGSGLALAATMAGASVSPTTVYTTNGESGYYAFGAGNAFTRVHAQIYIRKYAANLGTGDAMGIQLCNNNNGDAVQIGLVPNGDGTFAVKYQAGVLPPPTSGADPCVGDGLLSPSSASTIAALSSLPVGQNIAMNIKLLGYGEAVVAAQDLTTDTNYWSQVISVPTNWFQEAGIGLQDGFNPQLAGPATNELAAMRNSYVVDNDGNTGNLGNNSNWTAVQVDSSGTGSPPALITPDSSLSGSVFKIWAATPVS